MEGHRIGSRGHSEGQAERPGYHKANADIEPEGPGERRLYDELLQRPKGILTKEAQAMLDGEMKLTKFIKRHAMALALWNDRRRIGSLKAVPPKTTRGAFHRPEPRPMKPQNPPAWRQIEWAF